MIGASASLASPPAPSASSFSTKAGTFLSPKLSTICTTSLRPRLNGAAMSGSRLLRRPCSQAALAMAPPVRSQPMLGAPPKPAMRASCRSSCCLPVDLQGRADEHVAGIEAGGLADRPVGAQRAVAAGEVDVRPRARRSRSIPTSPPNEWICRTQPASIAGISVGWGLSAKCVATFPLSPRRSP